mmetsp:Transcript_25491/g.80424  ORF Transcript_25491/g.80424 Transcript_25491/m.80424 type:complete len:233 (+) Transcript_25491:212-910(+)
MAWKFSFASSVPPFLSGCIERARRRYALSRSLSCALSGSPKYCRWSCLLSVSSSSRRLKSFCDPSTSRSLTSCTRPRKWRSVIAAIHCAMSSSSRLVIEATVSAPKVRMEPSSFITTVRAAPVLGLTCRTMAGRPASSASISCALATSADSMGPLPSTASSSCSCSSCCCGCSAAGWCIWSQCDFASSSVGKASPQVGQICMILVAAPCTSHSLGAVCASQHSTGGECTSSQ